MKAQLLTIIAALLGLVSCGPSADLVSSLPGIADMGKTKLWSGYVEIQNPSTITKMIHYVLAESQSDPRKDPLVIWFNGGPGCSSMLGFMQENGPFLWETGHNTWTGLNNYSWNREANVLYIEQPAGVGFSYFKDTSEMPKYMFNDNNAAVDNLHTVLGWYEMFPEFKTNDLYISGESYAGVYVPYLLNAIHHHNQVNMQNSSAFKPPVKGMMVGNGVTNWKYDGMPGGFEMAYWHSLIPRELYDRAHKLGCSLQEVGGWPTKECEEVMDTYNSLFGSDDPSAILINIYDIFGVCWIGSSTTYGPRDWGLRTSKSGGLEKYKKSYTAADYTPWRFKSKKKSHQSNFGESNLGELPPCTFGQPLIDYLAKDEVKQALHVASAPKNWDLCTGDADGWHYTSDAIGSQWVWEGLKGRYRMLKYSGDTDGAVPTTGTRMWIDSMNRKVLDAWRPYNFTNAFGRNETGGYVEEYDGLTLATIHGAGHMTPQFKPRETYHVIFRWLKGERI